MTTDTGKRLSVYLYTEYVEGNRGKVTSFPVRVGYATTIHKAQGATLEPGKQTETSFKDRHANATI